MRKRHASQYANFGSLQKGKTEDSNYNKNKLKKDTSRISLLVSFDN